MVNLNPFSLGRCAGPGMCDQQRQFASNNELTIRATIHIRGHDIRSGNELQFWTTEQQLFA